jgi:hypothetical protein
MATEFNLPFNQSQCGYSDGLCSIFLTQEVHIAPNHNCELAEDLCPLNSPFICDYKKVYPWFNGMNISLFLVFLNAMEDTFKHEQADNAILTMGKGVFWVSFKTFFDERINQLEPHPLVALSAANPTGEWKYKPYEHAKYQKLFETLRQAFQQLKLKRNQEEAEDFVGTKLPEASEFETIFLRVNELYNDRVDFKKNANSNGSKDRNTDTLKSALGAKTMGVQNLAGVPKTVDNSSRGGGIRQLTKMAPRQKASPQSTSAMETSVTELLAAVRETLATPVPAPAPAPTPVFGTHATPVPAPTPVPALTPADTDAQSSIKKIKRKIIDITSAVSDDENMLSDDQKDDLLKKKKHLEKKVGTLMFDNLMHDSDAEVEMM